MIKAILVIGWRSDSGAYLVDIYPTDYNVDEQDLTNIFSVHRMAANGVFERAKQDFNFIRLYDGTRLVSWYSGFRTTNYLVKPDFCVALILSEDENPTKWEEPLHAIAYNILLHLEDPDFLEYLQQVYEGLNEGYLIEPEEGYPGLPNLEDDLVEGSKGDRINAGSVETQSASSQTPDYVSEFDELLKLADNEFGGSDQDTSFGTVSGASADPFGGGGSAAADPFGSGAADPFGGSVSGSNAFGSGSDAGVFPKTTPVSKSIPKPSEGAADNILKKLQELDAKIPPKPRTDDLEQKYTYMERKVTVLEEKINLLSGLINTLQAKEAELREKNALIGKLLKLLS